MPAVPSPRSQGTLLVLNAGSSSLKAGLYRLAAAALQPVLEAQVESIFSTPHLSLRTTEGGAGIDRKLEGEAALGHASALDALLAELEPWLAGEPLLGVGHRVVHGGLDHAAPIRMNARHLAALRRLEPLAPLHQRFGLDPIEHLAVRLPTLPQVACFDTAFHRSQPDLAQRFGLPSALHEAGIRRYGFHGLSYEYIASILPAVDPQAAAGRTVVAHLGNGASLCALQAGQSVASTMGFTAVDGLMMGTRCGALDPGVVLHLIEAKGMSPQAVQKLLYSESGLLGVSGISGDMRVLLASDAPSARLAIDLFCERIRRELGSMAAALGGLDALVFTAGIGEHAAPIRAAVCAQASWLGVQLDPEANAAGARRLHAQGSRVSVWCLPTDEAAMIARHTARLLSPDATPAV